MFECKLAVSSRRLGVHALPWVDCPSGLCRMESMSRRCHDQELLGLVACLLEDVKELCDCRTLYLVRSCNLSRWESVFMS